MAKNLTNRVTVATIVLSNGDSQQVAFKTKEAMEQYLYSVAVQNWRLVGMLPGVGGRIPQTRKGALETFYRPASGNSYHLTTTILYSDEAAFREGKAARRYVRRQENGVKRETTAGRTR